MPRATATVMIALIVVLCSFATEAQSADWPRDPLETWFLTTGRDANTVGVHEYTCKPLSHGRRDCTPPKRIADLYRVEYVDNLKSLMDQGKQEAVSAGTSAKEVAHQALNKANTVEAALDNLSDRLLSDVVVERLVGLVRKGLAYDKLERDFREASQRTDQALRKASEHADQLECRLKKLEQPGIPQKC